MPAKTVWFVRLVAVLLGLLLLNGCQCSSSECGDGTVDAGEECDDGNTASGDGCSATCTTEVAAACGDGTVGAGEECDDGNTTDGDGCDSACRIETPPVGDDDGCGC